MNWTVFINVFFIPLFLYAGFLTFASFLMECKLNTNGQCEQAKKAGYITTVMLAVTSLVLLTVLAGNNWPSN